MDYKQLELVLMGWVLRLAYLPVPPRAPALPGPYPRAAHACALRAHALRAHAPPAQLTRPPSFVVRAVST